MGTEPWHMNDNARTGVDRPAISEFKPRVREGADYPAVYVTWDDAREFCRRLTDAERRASRLPEEWAYRLPTEAEWEHACRAGSETRYCYGDDAGRLEWYGWFFRDSIDIDEAFAHRVGQKRPSRWRLHDMHGNVWEWCEDAYEKKLPGGTDPLVANPGESRVARGGGWGDRAAELRSASRYEFLRSHHHENSIGFRVALCRTEPK